MAAALFAFAEPASAHIANPGSFTLTVNSADVSMGLLQLPLPTGAMSGQIDSDGNVSIPQSSLQVTDEPFSINSDGIALSGTGTVGSGSLAGTLDPGSGAASLTTTLFASVTFTATALGMNYSGTCSVGGSDPADQIPVSLTTGSPGGVPYSELDGTVTLAGSFSSPVICDPILPETLAQLITGNSGQITVSGATVPVLQQDAHLSLSPNPVKYGQVQLGASDSASVTLSNSGADATEVTGLSVGDPVEGADPNDFYVLSPVTCGQKPGGVLVVPGNSSCTVQLSFTPTAAGARSAFITVPNTSSDGTQTLTLTGIGINPVLSASPGSLSFGQQVVGTTSAKIPVTVANAGTTDLVVTSAAADGDFSADASSCTAQPVAPGQTCVISVSFAPSATGSQSGNLTIKSNALSSPDSVSLAGTGVAPLISVSPSTLQFGSVLVTDTSAPQSVTVANAGSSALTVTSAAASGPFAVTSDACTGAGPIAPGGTCQIAVVFSPSASGPASGTMTVSSDAGKATVALSGIGSPLADLNVSIGASPNPVKRKSYLTYTITVQNAGPSAAASTVVTDFLPSNVQFESLAAPSGSSCIDPAIGATGTVKCSIGSVSSGTMAQLTIVVAVVALKETTITDAVKVTSPTTDPDPSDNQATVATAVK
jgi:uncharacterized repeat protein (TIGR01451 family)